MGTCHLSLQGLNHVLLQLLIFSTLWKEFRAESRNEAPCALGKTGRTGLQIVRYFLEPILWAHFLYLLALKSFMLMTAPRDWQKPSAKHVRDSMYSTFPKITHLLAFPPTASEKIFSAVWIVVFRAIVLVLPQIKFNSHIALFFFQSTTSYNFFTGFSFLTKLD